MIRTKQLYVLYYTHTQTVKLVLMAFWGVSLTINAEK